jgi:hypothetical protein
VLSKLDGFKPSSFKGTKIVDTSPHDPKHRDRCCIHSAKR